MTVTVVAEDGALTFKNIVRISAELLDPDDGYAVVELEKLNGLVVVSQSLIRRVIVTA